jgi:methylglyoxal/glyoxal reductase
MKITNIQGTSRLGNGVEIPYLGLGIYGMFEGNETIHAIESAFEAGYRHIDTATLYQNERSVGEAIRRSGIERSEIFVTTKVWNSDQGYRNTLEAFQRSLDNLQFNYIDLYLIHWPVQGKYVDTWNAIEELYKKNVVRAIGVSNFMQHQLEDLMSYAEIIPMVNQVEFHPYLQQQQLYRFCVRHSIQFEAWAPLMRGHVNEIPVIQKMAIKYKKTPVQIVLRWDLQKGIVTIPKSAREERIKSNSEIFDFYLSEEDMISINALDKNNRIGPHPENFVF